MRKKIRQAQNKDDLHDLGSDDLLSRLSDDTLVTILSYLPVKDVVVTSMLSRRWRYLWCQTIRLDFEDSERSNKIGIDRYLSNFSGWKKFIDLCFAERNKYVNWVNLIIRQHKSPTIKEFKICFDLDKNAKGAIGKWIEFAISKNVQRLELDLKNKDITMSNFVFPNKIFDRKCGSSLKRSSLKVPPHATIMEIKFLKALILKCVDVDDEGVKKILSNCPVLEHLSIHASTRLTEVKIHGKGLALKNLEIGGSCIRLESVDICDSNIVSVICRGFNCSRFPISIRLNNLEKVEKICIGKSYLWKKISHLSCLQALELEFHREQRLMELLPFPELPKLKQVILKVNPKDDDNLLVLTSLVEASPNLQRFKVEMMWSFCDIPGKTIRLRREPAKQPHYHLEVVEICGYFGVTIDLDLVMHFIKNGVALKKLIIEPVIVTRMEGNEEMEESAARYFVQQQLGPVTPAGVELVIL